MAKSPISSRHSTFDIRNSDQWRLWAVLFAVALAWRVFLIFEFPGMYTWDAFTRIWECHTLFVRIWLPLPQLPVLCVALVGGEIALLRCIYALFGAAACVSMGLAATRYWGRQTGWVTGWLVCFFPVFTVFTTVPYQEGMLVMFLGLTLWAWPFRDDGWHGPRSRGHAWIPKMQHAHVSVSMAPGTGGPAASGARVQNDFRADTRLSPWIASGSLALAGLCRYEAWVIGAVLLVGSMARKRYRDAVYVLPLILVALLWVSLRAWYAAGTGPPAEIDSSFQVHLLSEPVTALLHLMFDAAGNALRIGMSQWVWFGSAFVLWEVVQAPRRGGLPGREWLVILALFSALTLVRGVNSSLVTYRMLLLPTIWALPYLAAGITALIDRLELRVRPVLTVAVIGIVPALFAMKGYLDVEYVEDWFRPEAEAARMLCALPEDVSVRIVPRVIPGSILRESAVGAIFGQSMRFDPRDRRWFYGGHAAGERAENPDVVLSWNGTEYVFDK
ncbi:MAG: hypothetical protein V3W34_13590 [Phycisphaerae bacterium]